MVSTGSDNASRHISALAMVNFDIFLAVKDNASFLANAWAPTVKLDNFTDHVCFLLILIAGSGAQNRMTCHFGLAPYVSPRCWLMF